MSQKSLDGLRFLGKTHIVKFIHNLASVLVSVRTNGPYGFIALKPTYIKVPLLW
jgi:hypothetical protein